jgi:hypothetical protein
MYIACTCEECQVAVKASGKFESAIMTFSYYIQHKHLAPNGASFRCATPTSVAELFAKPENC